ncbi:MAG: four-helix bundle copper-binding protein [SAR202 cluster bacterium]|nr:four-helix bundle copper-binding protein [SAR202 cluster bacterium]
MRQTTMKQEMKEELAQCIEACNNCADECLKTISYCLEQGGKHVGEAHLRLMIDCVEICRTSANFMLRESEMSMALCKICADICEQCATSCESFGQDDAQMVECANACRACATSCRKMAEMAEAD